jgi:hypothetical protein
MNANEAEESVPSARGLRPVAVFDVDGVLCAPLMKPLEDHQEPGVMRIHFPHEGKVYTHVFLPWVDVMLRVLVGWGVRVCFFSSADASRNIPVLTDLVDLSFGIDEAARLRGEGQFAIHSKGLLRDRRDGTGEYGGKIKDMTRVIRPGEQLEDLVLIEDQPSYTAADQLPCLRALDIEFWNPHEPRYENSYIKNGAAWILGVFDLLLTDERYRSLALRPALAHLLFDHFGEEGRPRYQHRSEAQHQTIDRGLAIIRQHVPSAMFFNAAACGRT